MINTVDDSVFEKFMLGELDQPASQADDDRYNICCGIAMALAGCEYMCESCGRTVEREENLDHADSVSSAIRITSGLSRGKYYTGNPDYAHVQRGNIIKQLLGNYRSWTGDQFSRNILENVANRYNDIQKNIFEDELDDDGKIAGQKKFVRRGGIKDEVLAGLIYFECIRANLTRKKKDIAAFMRLTTNGFSRGEDILRNLQVEGKIDIPVDDEPVIGFIDRYLDALGWENQSTYMNFIHEMVEITERLKIGMSSQISSKVVGILWYIIMRKSLPVTAAQLERVTDNTKKNTFMKFYNIITQNISALRPVLIKYGY